MFVIPSNVTAISFDIWNTLLRGNKEFTGPRLRLIFDMLGYTGLSTASLVNAYKITGPLSDLKSETTGVDCGMDERLASMYQELGITDKVPSSEYLSTIQVAIGELRRQQEFMPTLIEPDLLITLETLCDRGYGIGLLSNTGMDNGMSMVPILRDLGIWPLVDTAVFSSDDGRAKPNLEIFWRIAEELHAEPHEVLHIGDNTTADYRAIEAGLQAVVYSPNGSTRLPHIKSMKELLNPVN
jgi:FMN phosphatase YigB (HAD superfamily)